MPGSAVEVPSRGRRPRRCSRGSGGAPARGVHLPPAAGRFSCWDRLREGRRRGAEGGARGPPALPVSAFPSRPCCQLPAQKPNQNQLSFLHFAVCVCFLGARRRRGFKPRRACSWRLRVGRLFPSGNRGGEQPVRTSSVRPSGRLPVLFRRSADGPARAGEGSVWRGEEGRGEEILILLHIPSETGSALIVLSLL